MNTAPNIKHPISWLNIPGYKGETWNPIIGCSHVSPGCDNCYAEKMAYRLMHMPFTDYYQFVLADNGEIDPEKFRNIPKWNGSTHLVKSQLIKPAKWKRPCAIFVCSMGDLFHESVSFEQINAVFSVMSDADQHIYIVLTKRPKRMAEFWEWKKQNCMGVTWSPKPNVWLGVTAENQQRVNERIPILLSIPAAKRFVSIEPMLTPIDLNRIPAKYWGKEFESGYDGINLGCLNGGKETKTPWHLDWVIVGGESGPKARPMHPDWVRSIRDQCRESNVPFFFKQYGKKILGCELDGKTHHEFPNQ